MKWDRDPEIPENILLNILVLKTIDIPDEAWTEFSSNNRNEVVLKMVQVLNFG
jgi:hypothetical protein